MKININIGLNLKSDINLSVSLINNDHQGQNQPAQGHWKDNKTLNCNLGIV